MNRPAAATFSGARAGGLSARLQEDGSAHHALLTLGRFLRDAGYRHHAISAASHQLVLRRRAQAAAAAATAVGAAGAAASAAATPSPAGLNDIFGLSERFSADDLDPAAWGAMNEAAIVRRDGAGWRSKLRVASVGVDAKSNSGGADAASLLFFHSAYPTLDDDAVFFDPDTYRFLRALRPALAHGVRGAHGANGTQGPIRRAVDIACGAGAGAVLIARHWPDAEVLAVDINPKALTLTAVNADLAGAHRVRPVRSDVFNQVEGNFDLIVAHPPYLIDPCGRPLRHGGGAHGEQRSFDIVRAAIERLAPGGRLLLYTGVAMVDGADPLLARLRPLLDGAGLAWRYEEIDPDIHGDELIETGYEHADRIAAIWLEAVKPRG